MKKFWFFFLLTAVILTTATLIPQHTSAQKLRSPALVFEVPGGYDAVPDATGRYIVVLNEKYLGAMSMAPEVESQAGYLSSVYGGSVKAVYAAALKGYVVDMSKAEAMALSSDDRVAFVESDQPTYAENVQTSATWGLDRIDQANLPLDSQYSYTTAASNVNAYIIDSGIRPTHVEFGGRVTLDFDSVYDGQNGNDCMGHGTHVAGIVGAATWGVAKSVNLHAVRVLPCSGSGTVSALIQGVDWVAANRQGPSVANISVTVSAHSNALNNAVQGLYRSGVSVVVAAGNANADACNASPGDAPNAITVGATHSSDQKAVYSNWGPCVDVWAPGSLITSVSNANDTDSRLMSGTSMASPHVAGVAALYLSANPTASPSEVTQAIVNTATTGVITLLDANSPNKLVNSWLGAAPSFAPARVTIRKRANSRTEATPTATFPYAATNFSASSFSLQADNQYDDLNVTTFGSANTITVTESQVYGWQLSSISCVETSGGTPNLVNSTVDLANRKATIIAEAGELIECTFTSDEIMPTASYGTVSGRIATSDGRGVRGVYMEIRNANTGEVFYSTTNSFGYYRFENLRVADFYVLTANPPKRYVIPDNTQWFTLESDLNSLNFWAAKSN